MTERDGDEDDDNDKFVVGLETEDETDWLRKGRQQRRRRKEKAATRYDPGDEVKTPDGIGVVSEIFISDGTFAGMEYTASAEAPTYAVDINRKDNEDEDLIVYSADDLEGGEIDDECDAALRDEGDNRTE